MASFDNTYFISQLFEAGAIQNVSDKRLTRISNISIGLVLAATAVGEFTDNEILQWVRKGRRMTPLIKEQYDMFRDLSQYLMNCVEEEDFESWKELLSSCRYVCPNKKTECSNIFGKVSQFCLEVKSTPLSNEAEEYDDNHMVIPENVISSNIERSEVLNIKDKKEENQNSSKNNLSEYPRFVKRNELSSEHLSTIKDIGQVQESNHTISQEDITPPLKKAFGEEKIEKNFGKHLSKKKNVKPDQENTDSTSVFSTNDEYNLNYKVKSLNKEPTSIEEPGTSSDSTSIDNCNLSLNHDEYDSDDSLEEEEMSVEIIDDGLGNVVNTGDLISEFNNLKKNDVNDKIHFDEVDNEIKELAKNVSEKLKDGITNVNILQKEGKIQDILADDKLMGSETEVLRDKKVVKETITIETKEIVNKDSNNSEDIKMKALSKEREQDVRVNSFGDIRCTVETGNGSEIIGDKISQISQCHVPDEISHPALKEVSSKVDVFNEDMVMISDKDGIALEDVVDKEEEKELNKLEKVKLVKQSVNEDDVCEKKTDLEVSIDNQIEEDISEEKGEFNDEFLEDLLFKEIDTSDTDNETENSEQRDITEQAKLREDENINCDKNLTNENSETILGKKNSIQNENFEPSVSKKSRDFDINISRKEDLIAKDISEETTKSVHEDQESRADEAMLVENRATNESVSNEEEEENDMKLIEFKSLDKVERKNIKTKDKNDTLLANKVISDGFENEDSKGKGELERESIMKKAIQFNQSVEKESVFDDAKDYKESEIEETVRIEETISMKTINSSLEKAEKGNIETIGDVPLKEINTFDKDKETEHIEQTELTENENLALDKIQKINEKVESIKVKNVSNKNKSISYVQSIEEHDGNNMEILDNEEIKTNKAQSSLERTVSEESKLKEYIDIDEEEEEDIEILSDERFNDGQVKSNFNYDIHNENKNIEVNDESPITIDENIDDSNNKKVVEHEIDISREDHIEESTTDINKDHKDIEEVNDESPLIIDENIDESITEKGIEDEIDISKDDHIEESNTDIHQKNKDIKEVNDEDPLHIDENIDASNTEKGVEDEIDISKDSYIEESNTDIHKKNKDIEEVKDESPLNIDENINDSNTEKGVKESSTTEKVVESNQQKQSEVMIVDLSDEDADIEVIEDERNTIQTLNEKNSKNSNAQARENTQTLSNISDEDEITEINDRIVDTILQVENNCAPSEKIEGEFSQKISNKNSNDKNEQEKRKEQDIPPKQNKSNILPHKNSTPLNEEDMLKEVEVQFVNDEQLYEGDVMCIEGESPIKDKAIVYGCENSILNTSNKDSLSDENVIEIIDTDDEDGDDQINKEKREERCDKIKEKGTELVVLEEEESQNTPSIEEVIEQTKRLLEKQKLYKTKEKCFKKKTFEEKELTDVLERKKKKHLTASVTPIIDVNDEQDSNQNNMFKGDENQIGILETDKKEKHIKEKIFEKETEVELLERTEKHSTDIINVEDAHEINEMNMQKVTELKEKYLGEKKIEKRIEANDFKNAEKHNKTSLTEIIDVDDEHENVSEKILETVKAVEKGDEKRFEKKIDNDFLEIYEKNTKNRATENIDVNASHVINKENTAKIEEVNYKALNKDIIEKESEADVFESERREIKTCLTDVFDVDDEHDNNQKNILEKEKKNKKNKYESSFKKRAVTIVLESKEKPVKAGVKEIININEEQKNNQQNYIQKKLNDNVENEVNKDKVKKCKELLNHKYDSKKHSDISIKDITNPFMLEAKKSKYEKIRAPGEEKHFESSKEKHENLNKAKSLPVQYDSLKKSLPLMKYITHEAANTIVEKKSNRKSPITVVKSELPIEQLSCKENKNSNVVRTEMRLQEKTSVLEDNDQKDKKRKSLEIAVPNSSLELPGRKRPKLIKNFESKQNNEVEFKNLNRRNGLDIIIPIIKSCGGTFLVKNGKVIYSFTNPARANSIVKVLNGFRFPDKLLEVCLVDDSDRRDDCDDLDFVRKLIDNEVRRNEDLFTIFIKYLLKNSPALKDCEFYSSCWQDIYVQGLRKSFQYLQWAVNSLLHINTGPVGVYILVVSPSPHVLQWLMSAISKDLMLVKSCKRDDNMAASVVKQDSQVTGNKILLSTPEEAVDLMLSSNNVSETLSALILDDSACLMVKHYMAMRRLANLLSFTQRQTQRGLNIVAVTEEVVEENVETLSQIFNSNFIIQDGSSTELTKKPTSQMAEIGNEKGQKCLSSRTEEDEIHQKDSGLVKSYSDKNIGKRFQMDKDETQKRQAHDSNISTSTSEEFTVTSESSEVVSSTEIITQQIITKKTIVNKVNKHYTFGKNKDYSSHIIRKDNSDSSSDATYDQSDQNSNRFESDKSNESGIQPNKSQNSWNCDSKNIIQDCSSSKRSEKTDRSVWRSGAITAGTINSKERRKSSELLSNSRSNSSENLSHSKHDFTNQISNIPDQQYQKYKYSGVQPSTSKMEIAPRSAREIVPKETFRHIKGPIRESIPDLNHLEHTQNRNDSFRYNRYDDADRLQRYSQNNRERQSDSYLSRGQYDVSRSDRSRERLSDYSSDGSWNTERGATAFYNQREAGAVRSNVTDHSQQRPYHDAARFSPFLREPREREAYHSGPYEPRDRDTFPSGFGPRDMDTFNRGSNNQRFNTSSDSDQRDRRRHQSGGYWK